MEGDIFSIEFQFDKYLESLGITQEDVEPKVLRAIKLSFVSACGQMLYLVGVELPKLSDLEEGTSKLKNMSDEVIQFHLKNPINSN